jgi:hypothetical protein
LRQSLLAFFKKEGRKSKMKNYLIYLAVVLMSSTSVFCQSWNQADTITTKSIRSTVNDYSGGNTIGRSQSNIRQQSPTRLESVNPEQKSTFGRISADSIGNLQAVGNKDQTTRFKNDAQKSVLSQPNRGVSTRRFDENNDAEPCSKQVRQISSGACQPSQIGSAVSCDTTELEKKSERGTYLGQLSKNQFDPNSTANPFGAGSKFNPNSINNDFGKYGSQFSPYSAHNPYATQSPRLYDSQGNYRGKLSNNQYDPDSVSNPFGRYGNPYSADSINNPFGAGNPYSPESPNNPFGKGLSIYGDK